MHRKTADVQLLPNDILYVPENSKAHATQILEHLAGFGESLGTGLILR